MPAAAAIPPFSPSEALAAQILDSIASPDLTVRDIAVEANTTLESLVLWLAIPEIAERLSNLESAIARRTRLVATNTLPFVAKTLSLIIEEHNREESKVPLRTDSLKHLEQRRRARETARRAGSLLLRLAKFEPGPLRRPAPRSQGSPTQSEARAGSGFVVTSNSVSINMGNGHSPPLRGGAGGRARADSESPVPPDSAHSVPSPGLSSVTIPLTDLISLFAAPRRYKSTTPSPASEPIAAQQAPATIDAAPDCSRPDASPSEFRGPTFDYSAPAEGSDCTTPESTPTASTHPP